MRRQLVDRLPLVIEADDRCSIDPVSEGGQPRYSVALGAFRDEDAAKARVAELAQLGVTNAKLAPRHQVITQTLFVIRDPQALVVAKIRDLAATYRGSEAKVGNCEKS